MARATNRFDAYEKLTEKSAHMKAFAVCILSMLISLSVYYSM